MAKKKKTRYGHFLQKSGKGRGSVTRRRRKKKKRASETLPNPDSGNFDAPSFPWLDKKGHFLPLLLHAFLAFSPFLRSRLFYIFPSSRHRLLPLFLQAVVHMGPRAALPHPQEDPWKASALISAFAQLLLTILVLVHTVFVCITFQLKKWFGLGLPCWNGIHRSDPSVNNKPSNPASYACSDTPLISTERCLKRSRSEDWCSASSKPLVCPKCHVVWSSKPYLSFKDGRGAAFQMEETSTRFDEGDSSALRRPYVEAGVRRRGSNSTCRINKTHGDADRLARATSFLKTAVSAEESVGKAETPVDSNKRMQTPVRSQLLPDEEADGKMVKAEARKDFPAEAADEGKDSPLLEQIRPASAGNGIKRVLERVGSETTSEAASETASETYQLNGRVGCFTMPQRPLEEVQCETDDDKFSVSTKENHDGEGVIRFLREALQMERKNLCALYAELEVERIASETAANEAMSMISRLQEEKAALHMEAAHYQRMAEEKTIYDEQAMQLLKEILYKRERENYLLEKEVKVIRTRFLRGVRKVSKRRKGAESTPLFLEGEPMLLLKDVDEVLNLEERWDMRTGTQGGGTETSVSSVSSMERCSAKPPRISRTTEEQPFKRLKGIPAHENGTNQRLLLASDTPDVQHQPDIALIGYNEKTLNHTVESPGEQHNQSEEIAQLSVSATNEEDTSATLDSLRALEAYLQEQGMAEELDFEGIDQLSQSGRASDAMNADVYASGDGDKLLMDSLPLGLVPSPLSERDCTLGSHHFSADERGNQDGCSQSREEAQICEVNGLEQSVIFLHKEGHNICSEKERCYGKVSGLSCSSNDTLVRENSGTASRKPLQVACSAPSNSLGPFVMTSQGTPHQAVTEFLQCSFHDMDLGDDKRRRTERDLQTRFQVLESDSTFQRPPSSLKHGSRHQQV